MFIVSTASHASRTAVRNGALSYRLGNSLGGQKLFAESLPVLAVAGLLNDNLLKIIGQLEDDVLVLLVKLEVVPGGDALFVDGCSVRRFVMVSPTSNWCSLASYCSMISSASRKIARKTGIESTRQLGLVRERRLTQIATEIMLARRFD